MTDYAMTAKFKIKKPIPLERIAYRGSMLISCLSVVYLMLVLITGQAWRPLDMDSSSSELVLSLLQCLLGVAALHLPMLAKKITRIRFPESLGVGFYIFVVCGTVLGEMFSLYYAVPFWDDLLHCGSGIMTGMLGSILLVNFFQKKKCERLISPAFIAVAAICFALCIGAVWEIYEFAVDSLLGLNMQKFLLQDGTELIGKAALDDTMKDMIVDFIGAAVAAISAYLSLKLKSGWLHSYLEVKSTHTATRLRVEKSVLQHSA